MTERLREANFHSYQSDIVLEELPEGNMFRIKSRNGNPSGHTDSPQYYLDNFKSVEVRYLDGSVRRNF